MIAIHFSKSVIRTSMPTKATRKILLGIETPLDAAMFLARIDKLGEARRIRLTPKQRRAFDKWWDDWRNRYVLTSQTSLSRYSDQ
jgi:hypothetical protein